MVGLVVVMFSLLIRRRVVAGAGGLVGDLGDAVGAVIPSLMGFLAFQVATVGIL